MMKAVESVLSNSKNINSQLESEKEYYELFTEEYLKDESIEFKFYNSLFKLIINGYIDDEELLHDFKPESSNLSAWDSVYQKMTYFRELKEEDIITVVKQVYDYALGKKYSPLRYGDLFYWLNYFSENSILRVSSLKLERQLANALKEIVKEQGIETDEADFHYRSGGIRKENSIDVETSKLIELQKNKNKLNEINNLYTNFNDYESVYNFFDKYHYQSIINELDIIKLSLIIKKSSVSSIQNFKQLIKHRFGFSEEKDNISLLSILLSKNNISKKNSPLKKWAINELIDTLKDIYERL